MMFVDGENFSINGRKFLESKGIVMPEANSNWIPDVFLWHPLYANGRQRLPPFDSHALDHMAVRSHFYTSRAGDEPLRQATREQIWTHDFQPEVFRRDKNGKSKGVDIALARDLLVHAFEGHFETAVLVAGDADYIPLVREVKRRGRRVILAFFASSAALSPLLKTEADSFVDLSVSFTEGWKHATKS
ncbi:MAG: NYN domain-containing protein [Archangium sp.]